MLEIIESQNNNENPSNLLQNNNNNNNTNLENSVKIENSNSSRP